MKKIAALLLAVLLLLSISACKKKEVAEGEKIVEKTVGVDTIKEDLSSRSQVKQKTIDTEGLAEIMVETPNLCEIYQSMLDDGVDVTSISVQEIADLMPNYIKNAPLSTVTVSCQATKNADGNWGISDEEAVDLAIKEQANMVLIKQFEGMDPIEVDTHPELTY